jgi:hypothetical protein
MWLLLSSSRPLDRSRSHVISVCRVVPRRVPRFSRLLCVLFLDICASRYRRNVEIRVWRIAAHCPLPAPSLITHSDVTLSSEYQAGECGKVCIFRLDLRHALHSQTFYGRQRYLMHVFARSASISAPSASRQARNSVSNLESLLFFLSIFPTPTTPPNVDLRDSQGRMFITANRRN